MSARIQQDMRAPLAQSLSRDEIRHVAGSNQDSAFGIEETGERLFQLSVERVVSGRFPGSRHVDAIRAQACSDCAQNFGMARKPEVIAAAKIKQFAVSAEHKIASHMPQRF